MLTSTKNPLIQQVRKLQTSSQARRKGARFVIEGVRLVEEVYKAGWQPEFILFTQDVHQRGLQIIEGFATRGVEVIPVASHVMQTASDTQSPQGILAVLPWQALPLPENPDFVIILDSIRDPGNLGAILRTAWAAGVEAALLPPGTVDAFAPKVIRAAMGAHFKLPIYIMDWDEIHSLVGLLELTSYLADSSGGHRLYETNFQTPLALIIGGEAAGAGREAHKLATHQVHIPMVESVESLNAAAAAAVLMFEVVRQRKASKTG
jgi:TrmH family RNA methyltransferase